MIKIFGHRPPDTDCTCSAMIWAWYLSEHTPMQAEAFMLGEPNKETAFVLDYWKMSQPALLESVSENDEVIIVDTNNPQELFDNINDTQIVGIIDHHKLTGGLETKAPLSMTVRPLASTASVMHDLMGNAVDTMPENIAGLMLSCILSDTLEFRSPTTTPHDKAIAEKLASKLGLDISEYATKMFEAKSNVADYTDEGLIHIDSKKYGVGDKNLRISVVETMAPQMVLDRHEGIVEAMKKIVTEEDGTDDVLFFVIDILKEEATVFTYNDLTKKIISNSFGADASGDMVVLPGVVSRKKQIIPSLKI